VPNRIDHRLAYRGVGIFAPVFSHALNLGRQASVAKNKCFGVFNLLRPAPRDILSVNDRLTRFNAFPTHSRNVGMGQKRLRLFAKEEQSG
jgi:hypothetical protein